MDLHFDGDLWYWRGPAPFYFVTVPEEESLDLRTIAKSVTYGWGMIPVTARIGGTEWTTSLFPKNGQYVLPVKDRVRRAEDLTDGDVISVRMSVADREHPARGRGSGRS